MKLPHNELLKSFPTSLKSLATTVVDKELGNSYEPSLPDNHESSAFPIFRKLPAAHGYVSDDHDGHSVAAVKNIMVEEAIVYFLLVLLLVFLVIHLVRCVRTTLDPYNTVARAAWFETLNKAKVESFP